MAVKLSSTNQLNKRQIITRCPVTYTINKIGGRWKPIIIYNLLHQTMRYGELKKSIPAITEKMLIQHLRELEEDGLVHRKSLPVIPPHVEYSLTEQGRELESILRAMSVWANKYNV